MTVEKNPWIEISPEEYDGHMSSPSVNQFGFLSDCFRQALVEYSPSHVAIVGCGTGNGLEHIDNSCTKITTVIDINLEFLEKLRQRFENKISGLEIVHDDLCECELDQRYSLVFVALVFEFLNPKILLSKISRWLNSDAVLKVVLQCPNPTLPDVSETKYKSLKKLNKIVNLVDVEYFRNECACHGLVEIDRSLKTLKSGKSFYIGTYKKNMRNQRLYGKMVKSICDV